MDDDASSPMMSVTDADDADADDNGRTSSKFLRSTTQKALKGKKLVFCKNIKVLFRKPIGWGSWGSQHVQRTHFGILGGLAEHELELWYFQHTFTLRLVTKECVLPQLQYSMICIISLSAEVKCVFVSLPLRCEIVVKSPQEREKLILHKISHRNSSLRKIVKIFFSMKKIILKKNIFFWK